MRPRTVRFGEQEAEWLSDPEFRAEYEALEPAYELTRLRLRGHLLASPATEAASPVQPFLDLLD